MFSSNKPKIAIDFDGTIVESRYPDIGKPKLFVFETLKKLQNEGYLLILWTYRHGHKLNEAVDFCKSHDLEFYAVNKSYPEEEFSEDKISRKIDADIFIDDRNLGGMYSWGEIYKMITNQEANFEKQPKSLFQKLFKNT
ncbi:MAG: hydrolase [Bacteroidetes bacterium]|jgi:hydroxymethylpyrimidine pyrophosphatase-like HAD family hydrolase|nr:hydrolase [Bacteroidota bacterium]